ncbi:DUF3247 family protein [Cognatiluteimonas weifangensis]|uniref:DUF3247 family protein n=1 Tax=Cognatiluteimonas weifangensis TaxID=2303539 RepID=A0A372DQM8_9GAMM|nr:DUF3247 family protein [Luteimonas weifangensis]RFP61855.1 DUF3247 family protein [Luteimonas weifangensis]
MSREAPRVHVEAAALKRLEALALQLPQDAQVRLHLDDGSELCGLVSATPSVQAFYDADGREGMNAVLRLESFLDDGRAHAGGDHYLWLDRIRAVERLPNPSPPEPSTRRHPPDPNAPTRE